jgi:NADH-quinone oxidoreductase subunit J
MLEQVVVYLFGGLVLVGGLTAALTRQILYSIIGLGLSLLGLSGIFLHLGSPFVAAMQLLIYIGGITVAIVFAMMLSLSMALEPPRSDPRKVALAIVGGSLFFAALATVVRSTSFPLRSEVAPDAAWAVSELGHLLLNAYNLVFEILSLVLLLAIVGAILIAHRSKTAS